MGLWVAYYLDGTAGGTSYTGTAADTVTITDAASSPGVVSGGKSAADSITITDAAAGVHTISRTASDSLSISDTANGSATVALSVARGGLYFLWSPPPPSVASPTTVATVTLHNREVAPIVLSTAKRAAVTVRNREQTQVALHSFPVT